MGIYRFFFKMPSETFRKKYPVAGKIRDIINMTIIITGFILYMIGACAAEQAPPGTSMLQLLLIGWKPIVVGSVLLIAWVHANNT